METGCTPQAPSPREGPAVLFPPAAMLAALVLASSVPAGGVEVSFPQLRCSLSLPDDTAWRVLPSPTGHPGIIPLEIPSEGYTAVIEVSGLPSGKDPETFPEDYARRAASAMKKKGASGVVIEAAGLAGVSARRVKGVKDVSGKPVAAATWVCVSGGLVYTLTVSSPSGTLEGDPQVAELLKGFSITPPPPPSEPPPFRFDIKQYWLHVSVLLVAVFIGLWLKTRSETVW